LLPPAERIAKIDIFETGPSVRERYSIEMKRDGVALSVAVIEMYRVSSAAIFCAYPTFQIGSLGS